MGLALFNASKLFAPVHGVIARLMADPWARERRIATGQADRNTINSIANSRYPVRAIAINHSDSAARRPVRVLRMVDAGMPATGAGRMVISGSMADVCAELDRLAAAEATTLH